jgi:hypothetical protein
MENLIVPTAVGLMIGMVLGWLGPVLLSTAILVVLLYWYVPKSEPWEPGVYNETVRAMVRQW